MAYLPDISLFFFEDEVADRFDPIASVRPVFELICGPLSLRERVTRYLGARQWGVSLRPHLSDVYQQTYSGQVTMSPHRMPDGPVLCINGRYLPDLKWLCSLGTDQAACFGDRIVALYLSVDEMQEFREAARGEFLKDYLERRRRVPARGRFLDYPWQLVEWNTQQLNDDLPLLFPEVTSQSPWTIVDLAGHPLTILGHPQQVLLHKSTQVDPFVVFDVRKGPIVVDEQVRIQSFTRIEGPCYIGPHTQLFHANIREGTTIGPVCRIGGEIEGSILHGYINKYHDGFLGHSYICPWVNLGAMTTNSDLKNNYSTIKFPLGDQLVETNNTKLGSLIGDHAKTAIGTMLNTGTSVGVMSMILPADRLPPRNIPSFTHWWDGELREPRDMSELITTAAAVKARRGLEFTKAEESLYRLLYHRSQHMRQSVVGR